MEFGDGAGDVGEGAVSFGFLEFFVEGAFEVNFPGGDVEHAVVEALGDFWEFAVDEFAILVDGVASEDDSVIFFEVGVEEGEEVLFDCFERLAGSILGDEGVVGGLVFFPEFADHAGSDDLVVNFNDGFEGGERV